MKRAGRLAVFCSGNGSNFEAICAAVQKKRLRAKVALMVCDRPGAPALKRAARRNVPVFLLSPGLFRTRQAYEQVVVRALRSQQVDLVVLAGFMRIFSPYFIRAYQGRIVNVHPSVLPGFKGAHAIRDAFEAGTKETGVSIHLVTAAVDSGPILAQEKVPVMKKDTLAGLEKRIHAVEHRLYPLTLQRYLDGLKRS